MSARTRWPDVVFRLDGELRVIFVNHTAVDLGGRVLDGARRALGGREVEVFDARPSPGGERHLRARLVPERDGDGVICGVVGFIHDVTELVEGERRYQTLIGDLDGMVYRMRPDGSVDFISGGVAALTGWNAVEFLDGRVSARALVVAEDRAALTERRLADLQRRAPTSVEYRMQRRDGAIRWVWEQAVGIWDSDGTFIAVEGFVTDVTQRREIEERLRISEARLAAMLDSAMDAIISVGDDGRVVLFNQAAERIFACPASGALDQPIERFLPGGIAGRQSATIGRRATGAEFPVEASMASSSSSGVRVHTAIVRDVSERRSLEAQLAHAQKMESVGRLAGGIAHDFNNMLTAIISYAEMAGASLPESAPAQADLREIRQAAERSASLTRQLLSFARRQIVEPRVIDPNGLVTQVDRMLRRLVGEDVSIRVELGARSCVRIDPGQLEQVLMNLAVNARDAMPAGGALTIKTDEVDGDGGRQVRISVADTGHGMSDEVRAHLFEPFFTTKPHGKGTGLGLATSYGIVQQAGGRILVDSEPGRGTVFSVLLPLVSERPVAPVPSASRAPLGTETILVVEDEPLVRAVTVKTLRRAGYTVFEASDGDAALANPPPGIDMLITDVVMPHKSGPDVAAALASHYPNLAVLFVSGYFPDTLDPTSPLLLKPFLPAELARRVRDLLDRRR